MLGGILDDLLTSPSTGPCITATRHFPAQPPVLVPFPASLDPRIGDAVRARGIDELYSHQALAWDRIAKGQHVVVVTATRPRTRGAPCGRVRTSSSRTPTCSTRGSCRITRSGLRSSRTCATS